MRFCVLAVLVMTAVASGQDALSKASPPDFASDGSIVAYRNTDTTRLREQRSAILIGIVAVCGAALAAACIVVLVRRNYRPTAVGAIRAGVRAKEAAASHMRGLVAEATAPAADSQSRR